MGYGLVNESLEDENERAPKGYIPRRYNIVALSFLAITIAYMMRANLSIAIIEMSKEFNWRPADKGIFLSSFFWGYITTQLFGGMAARKFGPKKMMLFVIIVPSCFTMLIPILSSRSQILFIVCRVLTGVASGATFPTTFLQIGGWVPFSEKALSLAIVFSGVNAGTIIIDVLGPKIMSTLGWPFVFYISGGVGFIWMILWFFTVSSTPEEMSWIHPSEVKYIREDMPSTIETTPLKSMVVDERGIKTAPVLMDNKQALSKLFRAPSFWNIVFCAFSTNWASYIFLAWLPTYVNTILGFDIQLSGIIAITPNISNSLVAFASGKVCDILLKRGFNLLYVRKTFFFLGCAGYIVTLFLLAFRDHLHFTPIQSAIILAIGTGSGGFHLPGLTANIYDIAPNHPSLVVGISNTAGTIPGIVGVFLTGILLEKGMSWGSIWLMVASFYGIAMIAHLILCNVKRLV